MVKLYTIGFTKKSAKDFFELLKKNNVRVLIDIRLNNVSQLAGYTKKDDLKYFLKEICNIDYIHDLLLSPTKEILDNYKQGKIDWQTYESKFINLLAERQVEKKYHDIDYFNNACLLCSECEPDQCHRRLVAEYIAKNNSKIEIVHIY